MFDPVILSDRNNYYTRHNPINNDYRVKIFSNYVPDESVIHKK